MISAPSSSLRVLVAPDKFKGTLTSAQAARAISNGLKRAWPGVKITTLALTDGGEGFVEVMTRQTGGTTFLARTTDAVGRFCRAQWGVLGDHTTAVIGVSNATGLAQLPHHLRNPEETTNVGTGRIISLALQRGFKDILIGLGGSATTEGGISLAAGGLGFPILGQGWSIDSVKWEGALSISQNYPSRRKTKAQFIVATDVNNPLFGRERSGLPIWPAKRS